MEEILNSQHASLDATDAYASAWSVALAEAEKNDSTSIKWGGRGKGGRGTARRTFQPYDIVVDDVTLEYVNDVNITGGGSGGSKLLLQDAYLKLLPGKVYSLIGRNGVGKSTLLKRIASKKIPGFPPHITSLLVPQEVFGGEELTPIEYVLDKHKQMRGQSEEANQLSITALEDEMDALDTDAGDYRERMEAICNQIAELEEANENNGEDESIVERVQSVLHFFGVPESTFATPTGKLSGGIRKKTALSCALLAKPQLLLLDEPTCHIDIDGILQLRRLIADSIASNATVVLVSHDIDLMNDVATDVMHMHNCTLGYYTGNYNTFVKYRKEIITHQLRQAGALEKQRNAMVQSIDNLKKKVGGTDSRESKKKLNKAIESKKKKLERHGIEKNEDGHRRTAQKDGIRKGSINAVDASTRSNLTHKELLKRAEIDVGPIPDKQVQFDFRPVSSTWGDEPLVMVMDVGHRYEENTNVFDCVELSIREGTRTVVLGENGTGKSTLLSIIAGEVNPTEGSVHYASGLGIGYFDQHSTDNLIRDDGEFVTPLSFLASKFPSKPEQDLRGELTRYGLSPKQSSTNVRFLSGGERCRLCMASMMLEDPQLIVIDEISNHLDCESVEALIYGLNQWNGTVVLASHDANLIRSIGGETMVLYDGKLRRIDGVDKYLQIFTKHHYTERKSY
mmetsp:Transcript_19846/g.42698  ORF Transcript_19846/g.42698 Transcript_19846/m.42698 type:complete len:680 (-) Transcript_19846:21-2060(-)